jgi:hypothetical protein
VRFMALLQQVMTILKNTSRGKIAVDGHTKVRVKLYQSRVVKLGKTTIYQPKIR